MELDDDPANRALRATAAEMYELLVAARAEGVWEFMEPSGDRYPPPPHAAVMRPREGIPPLLELIKPLFDASAESVTFYRRVKPDGRKLNGRDRRDVHEQLVKDAAWLRRLTNVESLLAEACAAANPPRDLERIVAGWRQTQRSLVLALSESAELRQRAYPADGPMTVEEWEELGRQP